MARKKIRSRELAHAIGMTEANFSRLKSGHAKRIRFETLARLCQVLDCQPGDIIELDGRVFAGPKS